MADQGAVPAQSPHDAAASGIEAMFMEAEGAEPAAPEAQPVGVEGAEGTPEDAAADPQGAEPGGQEPPAAGLQETEVEIEGEVYLVPQKIADRFIQHADYTKKTQDLAELRRSLSAQSEQANLNNQFEQQVAAERQHGAVLDGQIEQYKQLDWSQLGTEDLLRARAQFDQIKDQRAEVEKSIEAKRGAFGNQVKAATNEVLQAGAKYIAQRVPGFNAAVQKDLMEYGVTDGYLQDELSRITDPRFIVTLHKAMQWDKLQASAPGVRNKAARAVPVVRPGASVRQPSRITALAAGIKKASTPQGKRAAAEDYFAARFGGE